MFGGECVRINQNLDEKSQQEKRGEKKEQEKISRAG